MLANAFFIMNKFLWFSFGGQIKVENSLEQTGIALGCLSNWNENFWKQIQCNWVLSGIEKLFKVLGFKHVEKSFGREIC